MPTATRCDLTPLWTLDLGQTVGQLRATPVELGGGRRGIALLYAADFDVDPYTEMFFFPSDTLKLALIDATDGRLLWRRDLGRGVVPGMWFCPLLAWDLDGDGADELYLVGNADERHPLAHSSYRLERRSLIDGEPDDRWPWPATNRYDNLSLAFRNFILPAVAGGERRLVSAQGTYGEMRLQCWGPDLDQRWEHVIAADDPGARGSHMCPVLDLDGDGHDELLWGERLIRLDDGRQVFCADADSYRGHSDVIQPFRHDGGWRIFTCRESDPQASPRICCYDASGQRLWGALDAGHIDMGWVARLGDDGSHRCMGVRIDAKTCGPDGRHHQGVEAFAFDPDGEAVELPMPLYRTLPVDLNGDGRHELVAGIPGGDGTVFRRDGTVLGRVDGTVALGRGSLQRGREDGALQLWADRKAEPSDAARERWAHPAYARLARLGATGSNAAVLGGI